MIQLKIMSHCNSYPTLDDEIELEEEKGQKPLANMYQGFKAMLREKEKAFALRLAITLPLPLSNT